MKNLEISHDVGSTQVPLIEDTLGRVFQAVAARFGPREALVSRHQGCRLTYSELDAESDRLASALLNLGLVAGDRAGVRAPNCYEWVLLQLATAKIGAVLVNIDPACGVRDLEYALAKVGCKLLVTLAEFRGDEKLRVLRELAPELTHARSGRLRAARLPQLEWIVHLGEGASEGMMTFGQLMASGCADVAAVRAAGATLRAGDPISIQFTSAAGGAPQGATLTHRNVLNNGFFSGAAMQLTEKDRVCIPVPLHEGFGMVLGNLACLTRGATIVYPASTFEPLAVLETVEQERCTALHGLPTMFIAQLSHPRLREFNLSSLRTGIMAGAPCPVEVVRQVMERMHLPELTIAYGTSLTGAGVCQSSTGMPAALRMTTVGVAQPHQEIRIVDPATRAVLPVGAAGEACVRGYSLMLRYWGEPHRTVEAIDADGWVRTGDLAVMDAQGFVRVLGRIGDTVVLDGQTVYPRELEEFLHRHPAVADVQVLGVSVDGSEVELCACIVLKPGQHTTDEGIRSFCRGRMAPAKVPRQVRFVERFPMTPAGKVRKNALRELVKLQSREAEAQPA